MPDTADIKGLSDPNTYDPTARTDLAGLTDILDGRAANVYFYRTTLVDAAQNQSDLKKSLSTPPVTLPPTAVPQAPVITQIVGSNRAITLTWVIPGGPSFAKFTVFRTDNGALVSDTRFMTVIATLSSDPANPTTTFVDAEPPLLRSLYYRLAGTTTDGSESPASAPVSGRATRSVAPSPPSLSASQPDATAPTVRLAISSDEPLQVTIQRSANGGDPIWVTVALWLPVGTQTFDDTTATSGVSYLYRARGRDDSGMQSDLSEAVAISVT